MIPTLVFTSATAAEKRRVPQCQVDLGGFACYNPTDWRGTTLVYGAYFQTFVCDAHSKLMTADAEKARRGL